MKYLLLLSLILCQAAHAQFFTLKGLVTDDKGDPVTGANVSLYHAADSSLVKITLTDSSGHFLVRAAGGDRYFIGFRSVGLQDYRSTSFVFIKDTVLRQVIMETQPQVLEQVKVTAQRPLVEVLPDKMVFNVAASLAATGLSAFDVLRKAPGVVIDNQNSLIVEGKTGTKVYIDEKVSLLSGDDLVTYLKTLQSTDIEAIEIITQPSARFDAAGTAGIINLRLKKNKNYGTSGSLTGAYAIGSYGKYNGGASLNHRSAKLNIFSSISSNIAKNRNYINLDRFQNGYEYDERSVNISRDRNYNFRTGLYYTPNTTSTYGVIVNGNFNHSNSTTVSRTPITKQSTGVTEQLLDAAGFTHNRNRNLGVNLNYRYADKKKRELAIDADYGYYKAERNNLQPNSYRDLSTNTITSENTFRMITPVDIQLVSLKADYSRPIGKASLDAGVKSSVVSTNNRFNFYDVQNGSEIYNTTRSNRFDYTENINAAYVTVSRDWKTISMQAGLRAEQTLSKGDLTSTQQNKYARVKRNYVDLFPSGGLTWKANEKNSLALNYSRRIERPDYRSLNPFEYNLDELSFAKGNPYLQPQYTQTVRLSHTYKYSLTTALSYSYITNFFAQITDTAGSNRNFISPQNIANQKVVNLSISYPFSVNKWWSVYASMDAYRSSYSSTNPKFFPINQNTLSFYAQNTLSLPADYRLELSGWFSSPSIWAGTYHTRSLGSLDIAVQKSFLKKALSLRVAVSDVLHTSNWTGTTQYGQLYIKGSGGYESRQLRIGLSYNFGKKTVKAIADRKSGAQEEKDRIRN